MPRLSTRLTVWILIFLLSDLTTNVATLAKDIPILDFQGKRLTYDSPEIFWKRRLLYNNNSIEGADLKSLNKVSQVENGQQQAKNINAKREYKCMMDKNKTLVNYNGPVIMEDSDNASDQSSTNYIRVKRNGSTNNSIIRHQCNHSTNLIDSRPNFCSKNDSTISSLDESMSKFEGSYAGSNHKDELGTMNGSIRIYSRRKRGVLSKNGRHRKRIKGNNAKHHAKTKIGNKKHGSTPRSSHKPGKKIINKKKKPTATTGKSRMRSRIEKRESKDNSSTYAESIDFEKAGGLVDQKEYVSLINNRSPEEQPADGNSVVLPFVHAGKAELRVRIEKIPTNESILVDPNIWTDHSSTTDSFSTVLPKYRTIDEMINASVTNSEAKSNFESAGRKGANDTTMEITLKLDYGRDTSKQEASDSWNELFHNAEVHSAESALPEVRNGRNAEDRGNRANGTPVESAEDEDAKSRAKRNQERFKNAEQKTLIRGTARERKRHRRTRGRAGRSIEEIKELAEKLVAKVNELQMYVSNVSSKAPRTTHSCIDKNDCTDVEAVPGGTTEHTNFKYASDIDERREHLAKNSGLASSAGIRAFRTLSGTSRFARGYRNGERTSRRKWGRWMDWSSCSVTCGKGRQIRWRHCLHDCDDAETEMEEKACQLPACPPGKFLGIF